MLQKEDKKTEVLTAFCFLCKKKAYT